MMDLVFKLIATNILILTLGASVFALYVVWFK